MTRQRRGRCKRGWVLEVSPNGKNSEWVYYRKARPARRRKS
jgi:(2Fe-2S) ferredoxin